MQRLDQLETLGFLPEAFRERLDEKIAAGRLEIPILPDVAMGLLNERMDENGDVHKLSGMIHRDPAMASHVLRVANTALFSAGSRIVSLQQAVNRLGMTNLREIVISIAFQSRVFQAKGFEQELKNIWTHSAAVGAYSKEVARLKRFNVESAFLCGLLHDIGKPVLVAACLDIMKELKLEPLPEQVWEVVKVYHTRLGRFLAEKWNLPAPVECSITHHHDYAAAKDCLDAVMITACSNRLAGVVIDPDGFDEEGMRNDPVVADLNLYIDDVDMLLEQRARVKLFMEAVG